jgi:hypothetical protein
MALKDKIPLGVALPHRSPEPVDIAAVRHVAQRAEALGFRDLWVTENTLDHVFCFDPVVVLTYAAAVTKRIRLGCSVVVMAVHSPLMIRINGPASTTRATAARSSGSGSAASTTIASSRSPKTAGSPASARNWR